MGRRFRLRYLGWPAAAALLVAPHVPRDRLPIDSFAESPHVQAVAPEGEAQTRAAARPDVLAGFSTVTSRRFVFRSEPELTEYARRLAVLAERALDGAERRLGAPPGPPIEVRLVSSPGEMAAVAPAGAAPPPWASAVAYGDRDLVLLSLTGPATRRFVPIHAVLRHEIAHVVVHRITGGNALPAWFSEGIALWEAGDDYAGRSEELLSAAMRGKLIPLDRIGRGFPQDPALIRLAYAQGLDVVSHLVREHGLGSLRAVLHEVGRGRSFDRAAEDVWGMGLAAIETGWRDGIRVWYRWLPALLGGATLWTLISAMLVLAYLRQRRRRQALYAEWDREQEAAEKAAQPSGRESGPAKPWGGIRLPPDRQPRSPAVVYRDGRYHTLH